MAGDLPDAVSTVCCYAVPESLLAISDRDDPLGVTVPGQVIYASCDMVLALCHAFAFAVPHADSASHISARDIESGGRKASNGRRSRVLGVLRTY